MTDSRHDDLDWKDFLRHCASGNPAFYNKLLRLMTEQRWPQAARDNYLVAIGIEDPAKSKTSRHPPAELQLCPALPDSAKIDEQQASTACPWLDSYIQYSQHWSPRGYEGFHEACGLWVLATTAARRLVLYFGDAIYTNLMIALVARTTIWAKTSTAKISLDLLEKAGLGSLLAPNRSTPQAFLRRLTGIVSPHYGDFSTEQRDAEKLRLAFAAQRGWYFEEWGSQLQAMRRKEGPMQEFHGLLRTLDDGFAGDSSDTIARGLEEVSNPYLSLLCSATPADLAPFARSGSAMWTDGFWPRFALIAPPVDAPPSLKRRPRGRRIAPTALVRALQVWHGELGVPNVDIETVLDAKGHNHNPLRARRDPLPQRECVLTDEVEEAFYRYNEALIGLIRQHHSHDLDGCYGRFHIKALRIAMLLASLQNEGRIEMRHWARGQQIAERWRHNLHNLVAQVNTPSQPHGTLEETVLHLLSRLGPCTIRELRQNTRQGGYEEVTRCVQDLVDRGVVTCEHRGRTQRYHLTESATKCRRVDGVDV